MAAVDGPGNILGAVLGDWTPDPFVYLAAALGALLYLRGYWILHQRVPQRLGRARPVAFLAGLGFIVLAIGSPLDAFAGLLLQAHMAQHWLLMMVAPPLIWLGAPQIALLRGLPASWRKQGLGPFLAWPALQRFGRFLGHPVVAWLAFVVTTWAWHTPFLYELALSSDGWHQVEHVFFLCVGLLFWWPVVQPWPSHAVWPRWAMVPYLLLAALQNTVFSALFAFSSRVFYPRYAAAPRITAASALEDQAAAGALLWVASALILLPTAFLLVVQLLSPQQTPAASGTRPPPRAIGRVDLLRSRGLGPLLRSLAFRRVLQCVCYAVAALVVLDGFWGPQRMSSSNLAGVLPWTYWRGLVVIGLLFAGSLFCMACPFTLPRGLAKRWLGERFEWPQALRNKWFAAFLLVLYFALVEGLGVWSSPWATAWLIVGYFVAAFSVDGLFAGASFCKYVCPVGQFQFTLATASPLEIRALETSTCRICRTKDCQRGNENAPGCPTDLLLPTKQGNWDCTLCMDCVRACPEDNIGLVPVGPGTDLVTDPARSSLGRLSDRLDVASLAWILAFGAFANAAAMVAPVVLFVDRLADRVGSFPLASGLLLAFCITLVPAGLALGCGVVARSFAGLNTPLHTLVARFSLALLPLGFSMWLAHYGLHLYAGYRSVWPAALRASRDWGLGEPEPADFSMAMAQGGVGSLQLFEVALLGLGLLLSLYVGWKIALGFNSNARTAAVTLLPFGVLYTLLYLSGVWIFCQPMMMRGTLM